MRICSITLLVILAKTSWAQQAPSGEWASILVSVKLNEQWASVTDFGYRTIGSDFRYYQNYFRTGVRYSLDRHWSMAGGVGFFNSKISFAKDTREFGHEVRLWQDVYRLSPLKNKWILNHRFRLEEKHFDKTSTRDPYYSLRFQYRLLGGYRFSKIWNLQLGPEWMENLIREKILLDQVRLYALLAYQSSKGYGITLGYFYSMRKAYDQHVYTIALSKNVQRHVHLQQ